jgi:hypothetical protein
VTTASPRRIAAAPRPGPVAAALALVAAQIALMIIASVTATLATVDGKPFAVTLPVFLIVFYAIAAYYLWMGRNWARVLTMTVAVLGLIGHVSVALYYGHATTITLHLVAGAIALGLLVLLSLPASRTYYHPTR